MNVSHRYVVAGVFALGFAVDVFGGPILVQNGGMTQGLSIPASWNGKYGDCDVARDTTVFKEGPASLRIEVSGGKNGQAFQTFSCKGGEKFTLAGWARSEGSVKVNVAVQAFDEKVTKSDFQQVKYLQDNSDWVDFSKEVTVPEWARSFHVLILAEGDGKAWLDEVHDASLTVDKGEPVDPLVSEPAPKGKPWDEGWGFYPQFPKAWQLTHQSLLDRTKKGDIDIIFFGDSITQGWKDNGKAVWEKEFVPLKSADYGIGGDSTRQVLWRLNHGEVDGLSPKVAVLMIGTNNLYGDQNRGTDEEIAKGIAAVVTKIHEKLPKTRVLLLGLLPRQNDFFCDRIDRINAMISKLADGSSVRYLDLKDDFLLSHGKVKPELYTPDELHLVEKGYAVWASRMRETLLQMVAGN